MWIRLRTAMSTNFKILISKERLVGRRNPDKSPINAVMFNQSYATWFCECPCCINAENCCHRASLSHVQTARAISAASVATPWALSRKLRS